MKTCETCTEFNAKTETCGCPLNAYPDMYSEDFGTYKYARTAADSQACGFYYAIPIKVVKD